MQRSEFLSFWQRLMAMQRSGNACRWSAPAGSAWPCPQWRGLSRVLLWKISQLSRVIFCQNELFHDYDWCEIHKDDILQKLLMVSFSTKALFCIACEIMSCELWSWLRHVEICVGQQWRRNGCSAGQGPQKTWRHLPRSPNNVQLYFRSFQCLFPIALLKLFLLSSFAPSANLLLKGWSISRRWSLVLLASSLRLPWQLLIRRGGTFWHFFTLFLHLVASFNV